MKHQIYICLIALCFGCSQEGDKELKRSVPFAKRLGIEISGEVFQNGTHRVIESCVLLRKVEAEKRRPRVWETIAVITSLMDMKHKKKAWILSLWMKNPYAKDGHSMWKTKSFATYSFDGREIPPTQSVFVEQPTSIEVEKYLIDNDVIPVSKMQNTSAKLIRFTVFTPCWKNNELELPNLDFVNPVYLEHIDRCFYSKSCPSP